MAQIIQLDEHMINLIAAGEVIERAASVVKELVENAIDASATAINISLIESGLKEIVVSDNGIGMDEHEIKMAILPHATSKIKDPNDLFSINTLGFRGEALPSIIAVSNMKIKSCNGKSRGIMLGIRAGVITSEAYIGHPQGTEVQVRNLFFNTPARLQNLKSEAVELSYIVDYVSKISMANPGIAFKLTNNENKIFSTFGSGNLLEVINNVYDVNIAKNMITIVGNNGLFKVSGVVSNISVSRASKQHITLIVNKRIIRNNSIINAIIDGYKTLLPIGRYPICIIEILVDYSLVDVNVHPTKAEVRFSEENSLLELVRSTVSDSLLRSNLSVNRDNDNSETNKSNEIEETNPFDEIIEEEEETFTEKEVELTKVDDITENNEETTEDDDKPISVPDTIKPEQTEIDFVTGGVIDSENKREINKLYYIGQLFGTYLLAQDDDEFYLIDQHAANERVNYEKIIKNMENEIIVTYEIAFPLKLNFTPNECILIKNKMEEINNLGIVLEEFGGNTFIVRSVPVWMSKTDVQSYVEEVIMQVINEKKTTKVEFLDSLAKSLACKKSVKGNEYLSKLQIDYLLEDLVKCSNPFTCPHGRPIIIKFTKYEIEKWFKRVQ